MAKKQTAQTNNSSMMGLLTIIIILLVIGIAGVGYMLMKDNKTTATNTNTQEQPSTGTSTTPNAGETTEGSITTIEEAVAFALTKAGIENGATASMANVRFIYDPTYKFWNFMFRTETPSTKDTSKYDYTTYTVRVREDGTYDTTSNVNANRSKDSQFEKEAVPTEVALSSLIDEAKQKVTAGGATPGTMVAGRYVGLVTPDHKGTWFVHVVLAGEEGKDKMKTKMARFEDTTFVALTDDEISIQTDGPYYSFTD
ncbi:MAG: hypothetical protein ACEQSA_03835 [Weeksellaceae bacterium]